MVSVIFTTGNTITLTATYTHDELPSDLDSAPTVTLYAADEVTVIGTPGVADRTSLGIYTYMVTLPAGTGQHVHYAEFSGLSGGRPIKGRTVIKSAFAT